MPGAALLVTLLALIQAAPQAQNPFVGTWTANIPKSKLHPSFQFQDVTLRISVAGDTVTLASELTSAGQTQRAAETFRTDGTETPGTLTAGVTHVARWLGSHVLAAIAKKDGEVILIVTYQVSGDGKTLTSRTSGMMEQLVLFDRKQSNENRPGRLFP
jgi:hypothetical protein